jgi:hypothetical protein
VLGISYSFLTLINGYARYLNKKLLYLNEICQADENFHHNLVQCIQIHQKLRL